MADLPKETQYTVARNAESWVVSQNGIIAGNFDTQRDAFDAAVRAAGPKLLEGGDLLIIVEGASQSGFERMPARAK